MIGALNNASTWQSAVPGRTTVSVPDIVLPPDSEPVRSAARDQLMPTELSTCATAEPSRGGRIERLGEILDGLLLQQIAVGPVRHAGITC
jgi:hypothetical protein